MTRLQPPNGINTTTNRKTPFPMGTSKTVLLHHFQKLYSEMEVLGDPDPNPLLALSMARPYLLDTVLAVSASHLRHNVTKPTPYRVAEYFQQSLALRNFRTALSEPLDQQSADSLLLTAMLLNLLSFSYADSEDPSTSWVFSDAPNRFDWFNLQMGFKPLLMATYAFREDTILQWMYKSADDGKGTFQREGLSLENVPESWKTLCGLLDNPSKDNIFYEPARVLAELKRLEYREGTFFLHLSFFSKMSVEFRLLLEAFDERAMWLMGYWFGLLNRFSFWWLRILVKRDFKAVCMWFDQRHVEKRTGEKGKLWTELMDDLRDALSWKSQPKGQPAIPEGND